MANTGEVGRKTLGFDFSGIFLAKFLSCGPADNQILPKVIWYLLIYINQILQFLIYI